jgi:hypothetical protein
MRQSATPAFATNGAPATVTRNRDGQEYTYVIGDRCVGLSLCGLGAVLTGLISAGLPEINTTELWHLVLAQRGVEGGHETVR